MWLWSEPVIDAVISITSSDTGEVTVSPATLIFTSSNWNSGQFVTLTGVDDTDDDGDQTTTITISGVGGTGVNSSSEETVYVVTKDDDTTPSPVPTATAVPTPTIVPTPTPGPYARADAYRQAGNWSMNIREYSTVIASDPEDIDAHFFRAYSYHQIGSHWQAIQDYSKVLELSPSSVAYNNRGDVYRDMGRYEQAISDYTDAIRLDRDYAQAYNSLAIAEKALGKGAEWSEGQACSLDSKYCPTPTPAPTPTPTPAPTPKPRGMQLSVNGTALDPGQAVFILPLGLLVFDPAPDASGKYDQGSTITVTAFPTVTGSTVILGGVSRVSGNTGTILAGRQPWSMTASIALPLVVVPTPTPIPTPTPRVTPHSITTSSVELLAKFAFNDSPDNSVPGGSSMSLENTSYENQTLRVNGNYYYYDSGYLAAVYLSDLNFESFSMSADFLVETGTEIKYSGLPIVVGGSGYRWFSIYLNSDDELGISLNNNDYSIPSSVKIDRDAWYNVTGTFDLDNKKVELYLGTEQIIDHTLPSDFNLDVLVDGVSDNDITLTNYSNGTAFKGLIDNLSIWIGITSGTPNPGSYRATPTPTPASLTVLVNSDQDWGSWGNGTYTRCTGIPCGHLNSTTIHGREVYVKSSGVTADASNRYYYAYIFSKQSGSQTWPIQYVIPSGLWNAHRYYESENPWGNWGDLTVTANYD
jgi:hypothetical protein